MEKLEPCRCHITEPYTVTRHRSKFWSEGFRAGQGLNNQCPYPPGSAEDRAWLEGWVVGLHVPAGGPDAASARATSRWRSWLKKLLDH